MTHYIETLLPKLTKLANQWYGYYGGPVYLVGSSLDKEDPRDVDVRVVVSPEDFQRLFGTYEDFAKEYNSGQFGQCCWRWSEDRLKRCRQAFMETGVNIDFSCYAAEMWKADLPYLRLDTRDQTQL